MPQNAIAVTAAIKNNGTANVQVPLNLDAAGNLLVADNQGAEKSTLNITAATVVSLNAGQVGRVSVVVAGSSNGAVYDASLTSGTIAANQIAAVTTVVGIMHLNWPVATGILVVPGTGQTLAVAYR